MLSAPKSNVAWLYAGSVLFFLFVYIPVATYTYAFADDYTALLRGTTHDRQAFAEFLERVASQGRPIYAILQRLIFVRMHGVGDLVWLRLFGVAGVAAVSALSFRALANSKFPKAVSLALALMIGLMPCFQVYAAWATCSFFPWAALLAGLAFLNAERAGPLFSRPTALAVALLAASLAIYQPAAMMFWAFAGFSWLGGGRAPNKATVIRIAAVVITAFALDFAAAHALPSLFFHGAPASERTTLVDDIPAKLWWFVTDPLRSVLNLVFLRAPLSLLAYATTAFIASGLWLAFADEPQTRPAKLYTALALLPLAYFPNLIAAVNSGAYRTHAGLASLVLLYAVIALGAWLRWANATRAFGFIALAATAICAVVADRNVASGFASPQAHEYKRVEAFLLSRKDLSEAKQLYFVPSGKPSLIGWTRYDEFGTLSSMETWVPQGMAWLILSAHKSPAARLVAASKVGPAAEAPAGATVVNLDEAFRN